MARMRQYIVKQALFLFLLGVFVSSISSYAAQIDPVLFRFGSGESEEGEFIKILAVMETDENENIPMPQRYDTQGVLRYLRYRAMRSWKTIGQQLVQNAGSQRVIRKVQVFWINSSFAAEVNTEGLRLLAKIPGVKKIYANHRIYYMPPVEEAVDPMSFNNEISKIPDAFVDLGLDRVIKEAPGLTGKGVVLGSIDTGVDATHPALQGKIIGFFDGNGRVDPYDADHHGTHTAGTIVGGNRSNVFIGVAPDARLIVGGVLTSYEMILKGMQYMMDPDGDPSTADFPRVINNSWNCDGAPDLELFYKAISAWEAAGILPIFSAGNRGPKPESITTPHEHPSVLTVGATGVSGTIASFSSRGPAYFKGKPVAKPELTAPGQKIISTLPSGVYGALSGTSMAAPHITGTAALLLQIDPGFTPLQIRELMVKTTVPTQGQQEEQSENGWNPNYGFGKANSYRAFRAALEVKNYRTSLNSGFNLDWMNTLFTSPHTLEIAQFLKPAPALTEKDFSYDTEENRNADAPKWLDSNVFD